MKCVIVVDHTLQVGLIANTSAVLAVSIGNKINGMVGEDVLDKDGHLHHGITKVSIPMLKGDKALIASICSKLLEMDAKNIFSVDFCDVAQKSKDYRHYKSRLQQTPTDELNYLGIAICGPDKEVNALTGCIGLLR